MREVVLFRLVESSSFWVVLPTRPFFLAILLGVGVVVLI